MLLSDSAGYIDANGVEQVFSIKNIPAIAVLAALTSLIPAISMFMFRNRIRQIRFNIFNSILLVALQIYILYYIVSFAINAVSFTFSIISLFPAVSLILSILAIKKMLKDERLIQSLNRLRR
jgi:prepilin signal peptidase PulO-like enzyme (type II secretory pathway)